MTRAYVVWMAALVLVTAFAGPSRCQSAMGRVVTADGDAVEGATVRFHPEVDDWPPWLASVDSAPQFAQTRTDANGRFALPVAVAGFGSVWVEDVKGGLATLVPRVATDVGIGVTLGQSGRLQLTDGSRFVARLRALVEPGVSTALGSWQGADVALPAGRYVTLIEVDGRFVEHACSIEPGRTTSLPPPPPTQELPRAVVAAETDRLYLPLWPDVELRRTAAGAVLLPATSGFGRVAERVSAGPTARPAIATIEHRYDGTSAEILRLDDAGPSAWRDIRIVRSPTVDSPSAAPLVDAEVYSIEHLGSSHARRRVRSRALTDEDGRALVAVAPSVGECFLVVRAPGHAPSVLRQPTPDVVEIELAPVAALDVRIETEDPILDGPATVRVEQRPWGLAIWTTITDARGIASFGQLAAGDARITVDHPNYLPAIRELVLPARAEAARDRTRTVIELDRGQQLHGIVTLDGRPAPGVVVELRDSAGRSEGFATRLAATDAHGSFRFGGLPDVPLTLSARHERAGRTWSVRWSGLLPGISSDAIELQLVVEDPPLPGPDRNARIVPPR